VQLSPLTGQFPADCTARLLVAAATAAATIAVDHWLVNRYHQPPIDHSYSLANRSICFIVVCISLSPHLLQHIRVGHNDTQVHVHGGDQTTLQLELTKLDGLQGGRGHNLMSAIH